MQIDQALDALGVDDHGLTESEKIQLDVDGYLRLPGLLEVDELAAICASATRVYAVEGAGPGGPSECSYMQNKGAGFDLCFTHPKVLAGICHVLGRQIKSFGVHGRLHPPGGEQQALHVDYNGPPATPGLYSVCNSIWMLSDFTETNGATRLVAGSHLSGQSPKEALADPAADHPEQKLLLGSAGTVVLFNSHVWHGTSENRTQCSRPSLTSFFCRRDDPHMKFSSALSEAARERLGPAARALFADPEPWA